MKSLDTNVLARFFVDDPDDKQAVKQRPAALVALSTPAYVSVTVLLEFEWVLRGFYELPRTTIVDVLRALAGIAHITLEDRKAALWAMDALESGMDFADALHFARSSNASGFVTFDRAFAKRVRRAEGITLAVELLT